MNKLAILNAFRNFIESQDHLDQDLKDTIIMDARLDLDLPAFDKISVEDGVLELISNRSKLFLQILFKV